MALFGLLLKLRQQAPPQILGQLRPRVLPAQAGHALEILPQRLAGRAAGQMLFDRKSFKAIDVTVDVSRDQRSGFIAIHRGSSPATAERSELVICSGGSVVRRTMNPLKPP